MHVLTAEAATKQKKEKRKRERDRESQTSTHTETEGEAEAGPGLSRVRYKSAVLQQILLCGSASRLAHATACQTRQSNRKCGVEGVRRAQRLSGGDLHNVEAVLLAFALEILHPIFDQCTCNQKQVMRNARYVTPKPAQTQTCSGDPHQFHVITRVCVEHRIILQPKPLIAFAQIFECGSSAAQNNE